MIVAIIGSRNLHIEDFSDYLPENTTTILSGGAKGIDLCARLYAEKNGILFKEINPAYERYGRAAPLVRNREIVNTADHVLAFWDGQSKGTKYVITLCESLGKPLTVQLISPHSSEGRATSTARVSISGAPERVFGEKVNCPEGTREATLGCADPYDVDTKHI